MDTRVVRHSLDLFAKHVLPELTRWGSTPPPVPRRAEQVDLSARL
jgi:hypothetical protein